MIQQLTASLSPAPANRGPGDDTASVSRTIALTRAEREVLEHLRAGLSNKEIAGTLGKAEPTVKHQVSAILRKYGLPSRARVIAFLR